MGEPTGEVIGHLARKAHLAGEVLIGEATKKTPNEELYRGRG
jgi:hypothetical protein